MLPFSRGLGENYTHVISKPFMRKAACEANAASAKIGKKLGVACTWQAASIVAEFSDDLMLNLANGSKTPKQQQGMAASCDLSEDGDESNWLAFHPLGSDLIHSM